MTDRLQIVEGSLLVVAGIIAYINSGYVALAFGGTALYLTAAIGILLAGIASFVWRFGPQAGFFIGGLMLVVGSYVYGWDLAATGLPALFLFGVALVDARQQGRI